MIRSAVTSITLFVLFNSKMKVEKWKVKKKKFETKNSIILLSIANCLQTYLDFDLS